MAKAVISDKIGQRLISVKTDKSSRTRISENKYRSRISYAVPFRVKFINIGIEGYGPGTIPPIGIAVIGVNNYIL
jgi:hypothetical protein